MVEILVFDMLGKDREILNDPLDDCYYNAFDAIDSRPDHELMVLESDEGTVLGTLHLVFLPFIIHRGGLSVLVESVQVHHKHTGKGLGKLMFEWAIARAREKGAHRMELTSHLMRERAIEFYKGLGFKQTHAGMKLFF